MPVDASADVAARSLSRIRARGIGSGIVSSPVAGKPVSAPANNVGGAKTATGIISVVPGKSPECRSGDGSILAIGDRRGPRLSAVNPLLIKELTPVNHLVTHPQSVLVRYKMTVLCNIL